MTKNTVAELITTTSVGVSVHGEVVDILGFCTGEDRKTFADVVLADGRTVEGVDVLDIFPRIASPCAA